MTKNEIESYLSAESACHSKNSLITRVIKKDGDILVTYFLNKDQKVHLSNENKWIFFPINDLFHYFEIDGDDIGELKAGERVIA